MILKAKLLYKAALEDSEFLKDTTNVDPNDTPPGFFSSDEDKVVYGLIYYGYLLGKYNSTWIDHVPGLKEIL